MDGIIYKKTIINNELHQVLELQKRNIPTSITKEIKAIESIFIKGELHLLLMHPNEELSLLKTKGKVVKLHLCYISLIFLLLIC